MDAAMHESDNLLFVAPFEEALCEAVEDELIWQGRRILLYNNQGKREPPHQRVTITNSGETPLLSDFDADV
jgi:hypothetical protein